MLTKEQLDELAALEKAATPGPWRASGRIWLTDAKGNSLSGGTDDAAFITAIREVAPALIEAAQKVASTEGSHATCAVVELENEELRAQLAAAEKVIEKARERVEEYQHADGCACCGRDMTPAEKAPVRIRIAEGSLDERFSFCNEDHALEWLRLRAVDRSASDRTVPK